MLQKLTALPDVAIFPVIQGFPGCETARWTTLGATSSEARRPDCGELPNALLGPAVDRGALPGLARFRCPSRRGALYDPLLRLAPPDRMTPPSPMPGDLPPDRDPVRGLTVPRHQVWVMPYA